MLLSPFRCGLSLWILDFEATYASHFRCSPMTSLTTQKMALSIGFIRFVTSAERDPSYRVLTLALVGLTSY